MNKFKVLESSANNLLYDKINGLLLTNILSKELYHRAEITQIKRKYSSL